MRVPPSFAVVVALGLAAACSNGQPDSQATGNVAAAKAAAPSVALTGRVTDAARILSPDQQLRLTAKLAALEQTTGHQLVVVTVPTLDGADVATFTTNLANAWGIGRRGHDDGVVLLVAPKERNVRIAVGYGLEQRLPNALCQRIIDAHMLPHFRQGDVPGGIEAGADALVAELSLPPNS